MISFSRAFYSNFVKITSSPLSFSSARNLLIHCNFPHRSTFHYFNNSQMAHSTTTTHDVLKNADPEQIRLMEERVILVDQNDQVTGHMSKKDAHLISNDLPLHRAFSVFIFDSSGRLCLQQRAATKVTFPSFWTNTVCSHPLHRSEELDGVIGAKNAAIRKLTHELGIIPGTVKPDDLKFMTRILYRAECDDGIWGEHELDYVFFAQNDIELQPEPNEVSNVQYVTIEQLKDLFVKSKNKNENIKLTPWFQHIVQSFGWDWWKVLLEEGIHALSKKQDAETVHQMR